MRKILFGAALAGLAFATPASANLSVFACEPEWGALATEIGGDKVTFTTPATGAQDPHQIQAPPQPDRETRHGRYHGLMMARSLRSVGFR